MTKMKNKSILLIIFMLIIGWYLFIPKEEEFELPIFTPADLRATLVHPSLVGNTEHTIPNFTFINQDSLTITQDTVKEKIYVVDFFFTSCPSICIDLTMVGIFLDVPTTGTPLRLWQVFAMSSSTKATGSIRKSGVERTCLQNAAPASPAPTINTLVLY